MKERPILFNAPMVLAIMEGRKTQTRRPMKSQPDVVSKDGEPAVYEPITVYRDHKFLTIDAPEDAPQNKFVKRLPFAHGAVGDRLWIRETWAHIWTDKERGWHNVYKADGVPAYLPKGEEIIWTPSIHMPRERCRLVLEVTDVHVERLLDISGGDALAEGVNRLSCYGPGCPTGDNSCNAHGCFGYREAFFQLWDSLYGPDAHLQNSWVWVIAFKKVDA